MTFENFENLVSELEKTDKVLSDLYGFKVDLIDFVDPYQKIISQLLIEIYGEEGYDWFGWFCYENDFGRKELGAWDENQNPMCQDLKSLWEYLESLKNKI